MKKYIPILTTIGAAIALCGCVTPQVVKEASTKHAQNLNQLEQAAGAYRSQCASEYDRRIALQKEAYIAQSITKKVETLSDKLLTKTAAAAQPDVNDEPSKNFITYATDLREAYQFEARRFDFWLARKGADIEEKKRGISADVTKIEQSIAALKQDNAGGKNDRDISRAEGALEGLQAALKASPDDLAHVSAAIEFSKQREKRLAKLDLLLQQIKVMKSFHGVIDDYLAIDATIDGKAIAKAAAAGSTFDLSGLADLQNAIKTK